MGNNTGIEYSNTPDTYVESIQWNDNELETTAHNIPRDKKFSQQIQIPTSNFKHLTNTQITNNPEGKMGATGNPLEYG